jgi:hypothetical protein
MAIILPTDASGFQNGASAVILTESSGGFEPIRKSHFTVDIFGPTKGGQGLGSNSGGTSLGITLGPAAPRDTQYLVKTFSIPERAVEVKSARFANHTKNYPGERVKMPPAPLVVRCMATESTALQSGGAGGTASTAYQYFSGWFDLVYRRKDDSVGIVGEGDENVAGDIFVNCLHVDGTPFARAWLQYCWPSAIKVNDLDRDNDGDPLEFSVTFQCNDIELEF